MSYRANLRHCMRILLCSGPVGLVYAIRLAWLRSRLKQVSVYLEREKALHREHLRALNFEMTELIKAEQSTNIAAAQFWRAIKGSQT